MRVKFTHFILIAVGLVVFGNTQAAPRHQTRNVTVNHTAAHPHKAAVVRGKNPVVKAAVVSKHL
jgi:hypothetical protein